MKLKDIYVTNKNILRNNDRQGVGLISERMRPFMENNSAIRAMFEEGLRMQREYGADQVFDFSLGNPSVPAPEAVKDAIMRLLSTEDPVVLHGYMPNAGFPEVRQRLAENLNRRYGTAFSGEDLIMTVGAACGLNILLKAILDPNDEVIVFTPYFMEYGAYVRNYGGILREVRTEAETFLPDLSELEKKLSERTKAVIINSPNNPTGVIYGEETLKGIARVLSQAEKAFGTEILLISDEPYRELCYDGHTAPFVTPFYHNTAVCYSFSKSLSLPGERIGYLLIPGEVSGAEELRNACVIANRISGFVNAPSLMQKTVAEAVEADLSPAVESYDENRRTLYEALTEMGFTCVFPAGAFYLWMKTPVEERKFVEICKRHRVLVVPGSSFKGSGYVRIAYCVSPEKARASLSAWREIAREVFSTLHREKKVVYSTR